MKPSIVPTAPALRVQHPARRVGWLVLTVVLSLVAGSVSALFTLSIPTQWPGVARWLKLSSSDVVVIPATEDSGTATLVSAIYARQFEAIVNITVPGGTSSVAVIISNDGWLVTPSANVGTATAVTVTLAGGKQIESDLVLPDDYAGVTFIHIPKTNLPIVDLRPIDAVLGDTVLVMQPLAQRRPIVAVIYLQSVDDPVTETFTTSQNNIMYSSDRALPAMQVGAPVFDYHAQVLGLLMSDQTILPVAALTGRLQKVLADEKLEPVQLKLTYTLSEQGAKILSSNSAEILVDDLVTEVAGRLIDSQQDLSWALQQPTGTVLQINLVRAGTKKIIEISID